MNTPENWQIKPLRHVNPRHGLTEVVDDAQAEFFGVYQQVENCWRWELDMPSRAAAEEFITLMVTP